MGLGGQVDRIRWFQCLVVDRISWVSSGWWSVSIRLDWPLDGFSLCSRFAQSVDCWNLTHQCSSPIPFRPSAPLLSTFPHSPHCWNDHTIIIITYIDSSKWAKTWNGVGWLTSMREFHLDFVAIVRGHFCIGSRMESESNTDRCNLIANCPKIDDILVPLDVARGMCSTATTNNYIFNSIN